MHRNPGSAATSAASCATARDRIGLEDSAELFADVRDHLGVARRFDYLGHLRGVPRDETQSKGGGRVPWWWSSVWYEHQNLRDERAEAFTSLLWDGVYEYTYVARATTPGDFVVPPPKAEEMYMPETFGRGGSDRVIVE